MSDLVGRVLAGRYEVLRPLGSGGQATVFVARQIGVDRQVAVKVLKHHWNEDHARRFDVEAKILAKLQHPNTVRLFDFGTSEDGIPFMVYELVAGETLEAKLARGPIGVRRTLEILEQVACALAEAHEMGVVHRDLSSSNVMLREIDGREHATVIDFGVAKVLVPEGEARTSPGVVLGTPHHVAPEATSGSRDIGPQVDVYGLGVLAFHCITGRVPFTGTVMEILIQHASTPPPRISELVPAVDPRVDEFVDRMLHKDPDARPAGARDVAAWIRALIAALDEDLDHATTLPVAPARSNTIVLRRRTPRWVVVASVLSALLAGSAVRAFLSPTPAPVVLAARPAPPPRGFVEIRVEPASAVVTIDGVEQDVHAPVALAPGAHVVQATLSGYVEEEHAFRVRNGATAIVDLTLKKRPPRAIRVYGHRVRSGGYSRSAVKETVGHMRHLLLGCFKRTQRGTDRRRSLEVRFERKGARTGVFVAPDDDGRSGLPRLHRAGGEAVRVAPLRGGEGRGDRERRPLSA